ncbi:hypothetical protein RB595_000170 [Gaeumannomyces hyphopodioides]
MSPLLASQGDSACFEYKGTTAPLWLVDHTHTPRTAQVLNSESTKHRRSIDRSWSQVTMKIAWLVSAVTLLATLGQAYPLAQETNPKPAGDGASVQNVDGCPDIIIVFARGTSEPGNIGIIVGPQLLDAVKTAAEGKSVGMQGVSYAATFYGFLAGGDKDGGGNMTKVTTDFVNKCPNSNVVISGYSQGAQVTHLAAQGLSADVQAKISSAVVFGDPLEGQPIQGVPKEKTLSVCRDGDTICRSAGTLILIPHLEYDQDVGKAAQFILGQIKSRRSA